MRSCIEFVFVYRRQLYVLIWRVQEDLRTYDSPLQDATPKSVGVDGFEHRNGFRKTGGYMYSLCTCHKTTCTCRLYRKPISNMLCTVLVFITEHNRVLSTFDHVQYVYRY